MIERLIRLCATNRLVTLAITAALVFVGIWSMNRIALDALPDLSDTQVIIYSKWDRSPDIIEDQVTYPIITSLLGAPKVKAVRGFSDFGYSYVYVVFDEGTDLYWARSRVLESLSKTQASLPQGVKTELGPDATGVGWVFQYALSTRAASTPWPTSARCRIGPFAINCSPSPASRKWPPWADSCGSTRSPSIRTSSRRIASR